MNKKILIGSIIAVLILLLMPSIPAIQHKVINDDIKEKILSEIPKDLDIKDIRELLENGFLATSVRRMLTFFPMNCLHLLLITKVAGSSTTHPLAKFRRAVSPMRITSCKMAVISVQMSNLLFGSCVLLDIMS